MSKDEQIEQTAGNIQTAVFTSADKGFQAKKWFFTYHIKLNDESFEQAFERLEGLKSLCDKFVWGEEYGKSGTTPHIQGAFILSGKMRATTLQSNFFFNGVSLFKLKNWESSLKYCIKECNKIHSNVKLPRPLKVLQTEQLYPYQKSIVDYVKTEPNDRDIFWIWGDYNIGKTQLSKYLCYNKLAFGPLEGEKKHILSVVADNTNEEAFIIYLTAKESNYQNTNLFTVLEKIKDGFFMSHFGTDGTKPVYMNSPHILVFANAPPNFERTDMDPERFIIKQIDEETKDWKKPSISNSNLIDI